MNAARSFAASAAIGASVVLGAPSALGATLATHSEVRGAPIEIASVRSEGGAWRSTAWGDLAATVLAPGRYEVRVQFSSDGPGEAVQIPPCAGRSAARVDAVAVTLAPGPVAAPVGPGDHELTIALDVSKYERRIACGEPPRVGVVERTLDGLGTLAFDSPHASSGGGKAVVYVPPGRALPSFSALLVGLHPWNGSPWTYAAYAELLAEARARGVLLLMPSGLGNSLYTADAEDEVLRAIDAIESVVRASAGPGVTPRLEVSLWGASMGGAGATTIGFHHPDRFATVTSFFGDSRYDLSTYVHAILRDPAAAHAVNALDVVDNARNLPVWLIHGEADVTSPIRQSEILAASLEEHGFAVRFDRVPGLGHAGSLVARFLPELVAAAARASTSLPSRPSRVTYWSVRPSDTGAYGVAIERASPAGDAFIDVERRSDGLHVVRADGVRAVSFAPGALGSSLESPPPIAIDDRSSRVAASWSKAGR